MLLLCCESSNRADVPGLGVHLVFIVERRRLSKRLPNINGYLFVRPTTRYQRQDEDGAADEGQTQKQESVQETRQRPRQESIKGTIQESRKETTQETTHEAIQEVRQETRHDARQGARQDARQGIIQEEQKEPSREDCTRRQAVGGLVQDLGVVDPDDDPLSCLKDEEGEAGSGRGRRPPMRRLVAPVDPKLAVSSRAINCCEFLLCDLKREKGRKT